MEITVKNLQGKDTKFSINELIEINGTVFKVTEVTVYPQSIKIEPAGSDHVRQYNENQKGIKISSKNVKQVVYQDTDPKKPNYKKDLSDVRYQTHDPKKPNYRNPNS